MENNKQIFRAEVIEKNMEEIFLETKSNLVLENKVQEDLIAAFRTKHSRKNDMFYLSAAIFIGVIFTLYIGFSGTNKIQIAKNNYASINNIKSKSTIKDSSFNKIENHISKTIKSTINSTKLTSTSDLCKSIEIVIPVQQEMSIESLTTFTSSDFDVKMEGLNEGIVSYDLMNMVVINN